MVKIPFEGEERELLEVLALTREDVNESDNSDARPEAHCGNYYIVGDWRTNEEEYENAVSSVQKAWDILAELELAQKQGSPSKKEIKEKLKPFQDFRAIYTCTADAWGQGDSHADQRLDDAERAYDLGKIVRQKAEQLLDSFRGYYLVFGDELSGGYGYWLDEDNLEERLKGEKHLTYIKSGSFPEGKRDLVVRTLERACGTTFRPFFKEELKKLEQLLEQL